MNFQFLNKCANKIAPSIKKLGSSPDPFFTIAVLCIFNATVRPLITLSDKNQPKERKYYAALREFVTELVALPTCAFFARYLGGKLAGHFAKAPNTVSAVKNVFSMGGLLVANFTIPILSNIILEPIMKDVKKKIKADNKTQLNVISESNNQPLQTINPIPVQSPQKVQNIWSYYNFTNKKGLTIGQ